MNTFGIIDINGCHIDTSKTIKGAKRYATINGYTKVSMRYNGGYIARIVAEKISGKWTEVNQLDN